MYSKMNTAIMEGLSVRLISVEVDISSGMPMMELIGHLSSEVKEAKNRVKTALHNCGIELPVKRITVNIYPAELPKSGTGFDLPIAVGLLEAMQLIPALTGQKTIILGELALDGSILPVRGILPVISEAQRLGYQRFLIPMDNLAEGRMVGHAEVYGFSHMKEVIAFLRGKTYQYTLEPKITEVIPEGKDFSEVNGQFLGRRVCEICASGMHNLLFVGPPGAGKTMLAERIPTILPDLTEEERLEIAKIYSISGKLKNHEANSIIRPFVQPHHATTRIALLGGGTGLNPGEISLAHNGILFLDELTEFAKETLEALRIPLEEHKIRISRVSGNVEYPASFLFVGAMNPCNCGYYPDMNRCHCSQATLKRHMEKLSQPLLERIDLCAMTQVVDFEEIIQKGENESSASIRKRVALCHEIQKERYRGENFLYNSQIPADKMERYCKLGRNETVYMKQIYETKSLTGRTYYKIIRVARTLADMEQETDIAIAHLKEAVQFRCLNQKNWGA